MGSIQSAIKVARGVTEWLVDELPSLTFDDWQRANACGVWSVADVAAHLLWVADMYGDGIRRALADDAGPPTGLTAPANRAAPDAPIAWQRIWSEWPTSRAAIPSTYRQDLGDRMPDALASWSRALVALFESLAPADWDRPAYHPAGVRSIQQMLFQYILEVCVHGWDILHRLGRDVSISEASHAPLVAVLPSYVQSRFVPRERLPEPERYLFVLGPTVPSNMRLTVYGDAFEIAPEPNDGGPDVVLTMAALTYVLLFMGRLSWEQAIESGSVAIAGRRDLATNLSSWFGLT